MPRLRRAGTTPHPLKGCGPSVASIWAGPSRRTSFATRRIATWASRHLEDSIRFLEGYFRRRDANDLLAMLWTWQHADISANEIYKGDFAAALGAIKARAIVMPGDTDLYFRVRDNELEVEQMPHAELRPIPSIWGHVAGLGVNPPDNAFIDAALKELLAA